MRYVAGNTKCLGVFFLTFLRLSVLSSFIIAVSAPWAKADSMAGAGIVLIEAARHIGLRPQTGLELSCARTMRSQDLYHLTYFPRTEVTRVFRKIDSSGLCEEVREEEIYTFSGCLDHAWKQVEDRINREMTDMTSSGPEKLNDTFFRVFVESLDGKTHIREASMVARAGRSLAHWFSWEAQAQELNCPYQLRLTKFHRVDGESVPQWSRIYGQ